MITTLVRRMPSWGPGNITWNTDLFCKYKWFWFVVYKGNETTHKKKKNLPYIYTFWGKKLQCHGLKQWVLGKLSVMEKTSKNFFSHHFSIYLTQNLSIYLAAMLPGEEGGWKDHFKPSVPALCAFHLLLSSDVLWRALLQVHVCLMQLI